MDLLSITAVDDGSGRHVFRLAFRRATGATVDAVLAAAELQSYAATQRGVLEQTGGLFRFLDADDKPDPYASWLWREFVAHHLNKTAAPAAKVDVN